MTKNQLTYQINNGKEVPYKSNAPLSYITIPLEFTLPKHIDIKNTGTHALYVNLIHSGSPQKIAGYYAKSNKLTIVNQYYYLDNSPIKILNLNAEEFYKQIITYKNLDYLLKQNLSISIPIPCGVELIYSNVPFLTDENRANNKGVIQTQFILKPFEVTEIVMVYKTKFKGRYISYPIKTFNNNIFYSETYTPQSNINIK